MRLIHGSTEVVGYQWRSEGSAQNAARPEVLLPFPRGPFLVPTQRATGKFNTCALETGLTHHIGVLVGLPRKKQQPSSRQPWFGLVWGFEWFL